MTIPEPRFEHGRALRIAGLHERYPLSDCSGIPDQWTRFRPWLGQIPGAVPGAAYGVCCATDNPGLLDYYAGVEVKAGEGVPDGLSVVEVPAQHYAIFAFSDPISNIQQAIGAIWGEWMPASGKQAGHGPSLERYGEGFDSVTGEGGFEIWVPVEP